MADVEPFTVPPAGVDTIDISIEETYSVEGVGEDTVQLKGSLVADRGAPLVDPERGAVDWETSTVVASFRSLTARGESKVFGAVHVTLDHRTPSFGVVKAGACAANLALVVSMPQHRLTLRSEDPVQLRSQVTTVPPIGDERTESIAAVPLLDAKSHRKLGTIDKARVTWRELTAQVEHRP
jgi:Family of unknown function (DUF6073)